MRFLYLVLVVALSIAAVQDFQAGEMTSGVIDSLLVFGNVMFLTFVGSDR